jgi:predicted HTH domain antitoxin
MPVKGERLALLFPVVPPRHPHGLDDQSISAHLSLVNTTMNTLTFPATVPESFERSIEMTRSELDHHLRLMAALKMFELGQISSGKAAELAGMSRVDFFQTCSRYHVSIFNYSAADAEYEIRSDLQTFSSLAKP